MQNFWPLIGWATAVLFLAPGCLRQSRECTSQAECFAQEVCQGGTCITQSSGGEDVGGLVDMWASRDMSVAGDMKNGQRDMGGSDMLPIQCGWDKIDTKKEGITGALGAGGDNTLALDSRGCPHIAYLTGLGEKLAYSRWEGDQWTTEVFEEPQAGHSPSLDLDSKDHPHIMSQKGSQGSPGSLFYAWYNGRWIDRMYEFFPLGINLRSPYLIVDSKDGVHVLYREELNKKIWYSHTEDFTWNSPSSSVEFSQGPPGQFTLVVDGSQKPHVAYRSTENPMGLFYEYQKKGGGGWRSPENIEEFNQTGWGIVLQLDKNELPHVAYYNGINEIKTLHYSKKGDQPWKDTPSFVLGDTTLDFLSFVLDNDGSPHISYQDKLGEIRYIRKNEDDSWSDPLPVSKEQISDPSLAVDSFGRPAMIYHKDGKLYFTYLDKGEWK